MKRKLTAGQTAVSLPIFVQDTSSTTGGGLSGLTSATSGLVAEYRRRGQSSWTAITLTSKTLGTWTSGGFVADGALGGAYELDLPDAVCASGARWVAVRLRGAANMLPCLIEIELDAFDYQTATQPVNVTQFGGNAGTFASGRPEVRVASMADNTLTAAAIAADAGAELAALVETYIVNEGDATAVLQAVADKIAADWVAGDASPLAIASAVWSAGTRTITGGSLTTSPPTAAAIADAVWDEARTGHTTSGTFGFYLDAAVSSAAGSGTGTGARTVTITVNDGTTALQNAKVRLTEGANTFVGTTNASGVVTFNVDDATYTVAITKSGYSYAGTTLVVDGTEAVTYSMTAVTIPSPSSPDKTVLTILCLDSDGDAASGINISIRYTAIPTGSEDTAFPGGTITKTSNGSGIASFEVIKGATIEYKRGTRDVWVEAVMSDEDTTSITSFIGTP